LGKINILDDESANLIAAGEVVDRPSSALKELIENSIDAGATKIEVFLKSGGNRQLRVSDNGEGILREDLPKTLYRHATSKIKHGREIDGVPTLGFRGEALAAASSVCRLEIITKTREEDLGSRLISDETGVEIYETGCPDGTTVTLGDMFYNLPARKKFMKKDSSEAFSCFSVCEKLSLSHPEIAFSLFSEDTLKFRTPGDGRLFSAIYSLYGSKAAEGFQSVEYEFDKISVSGFISKPDSPRGTRGGQTFFINGRYIKSRSLQAALEEAYRSFIPSGKFPAAVLNITLPRGDVDVNVHPAKTEVKFANEKAVFSCVYYGVKTSLDPGEAALSQSKHQTTPPPPEKTVFERPNPAGYGVFSAKTADGELTSLVVNNSPDAVVNSPDALPEAPGFSDGKLQTALPEKPEVSQSVFISEGKYKVIGEAYDAYIFAESDENIIIVDKHAAHERLIYERLKKSKTLTTQALLFPITITLTPSEAEIILKNAGELKEHGFYIDEFGPSTVAVREIPSVLKDTGGIKEILETFAKSIAENTSVDFSDKVDSALFTVACKAALKAGESSGKFDAEYIIDGINRQNLKFCPHGRPFIKEIPKREIEKYFNR